MQQDGLLRLPNTPNDWLVIMITVFSFFYVMYKKSSNPELKNPSLKDWVANFCLSGIIANSMYEWFLVDKMKIEYMYFPLFLSIVLVPDLIDYLTLDKQGKFFVIKTFKSIVNGFFSTILKNFGYEKNNEKTD